jgi:hypothetical protein
MTYEPHDMVGRHPIASNDRGFLIFGGYEILTDHGHPITVQESSSARGPAIWLFIGPSIEETITHGDPHLDLRQALVLRAALDQFIEGVPDRWADGAERLAEAKRLVFGPETDPGPPALEAGKI